MYLFIQVGVITHLEERAMNIMGKYSQKLIERRHQDVRDQASEVIETSKLTRWEQ